MTKRLADGGEAIGKDKLTVKQQAFADAFIELGNATQAYLKAYPNVKNEETASAAGSRMLGNVKVKAYIDERLAEIASNRIADAQEVMETLTKVLRGEARAAALVGVGGGEEFITKDMPPTMAERIKAAELIGKRFAMWTDKQEVSGTVTPIFVDDISGDDK